MKTSMNQKKNDSLIDSLEEACDYMMDIISEGAYRKYMNKKADEQDELIKKADRYGDLAYETLSDKAKKDLLNKSGKYTDRASNMYDELIHRKELPNTEDSNSRIRDTLNRMDAVGRVMTNKKIYDDYKEVKGFKKEHNDNKEAKEKWMRNHGNSGEDKLGNRKPGTFKTSEGLSKDHEAKDQKKKAIKETCLYILSVLDEI